MILSENSSTLGSRCCSAARSETEWQRNESWKVRLLELPPKLNMQARERRPPQVRAPCVRVVYTVTVDTALQQKVRFVTVANAGAGRAGEGDNIYFAVRTLEVLAVVRSILSESG